MVKNCPRACRERPWKGLYDGVTGISLLVTKSVRPRFYLLLKRELLEGRRKSGAKKGRASSRSALKSPGNRRGARHWDSVALADYWGHRLACVFTSHSIKIKGGGDVSHSRK